MAGKENKQVKRIITGVIITAVAVAAVCFVYFNKYSITLSEHEKRLLKNAGVPADTALAIKRDAYNVMFLGVKKTEISQLQGNDADGNTVPENGVVFSLDSGLTDSIMVKYREGLKKKGLFMFCSSQDNEPGPDEIAIFKAADQYDILRVMGSCGADYGITNTELITRLKEWEKICSFEITGAEYDMVKAVFTRRPDDMDSFADEVYRFCPDDVDQGAGSVEALAEEMRENNTLYMWWD